MAGRGSHGAVSQGGEKPVVYHAVRKEQTTADALAGRAVRQQALIQEIQELRKALQKSYALQRRLERCVQGRGACRGLKRQRRKLLCEVSQLKDLLAEREESLWEQDIYWRSVANLRQDEGSPGR